jgi:hypothetical protein
MTRVDLTNIKFSVDGKIIRVSEKDIKFDTEYEIRSARTGRVETFRFSHSTGSEWDPKTEWVYVNGGGIEFRVCNDPVITAQLAADYLKSKAGRVS